MDQSRPRRRALCVRPLRNEQAPPFLHTLVDEWVDALGLHCDVTSVEQDFDFKEICDRVQPDFVIFDAIHWARPQRLAITNVDAYPHIPRALFINCDPHDPMRPHFMDMLVAYGIDTVFCGVEHLKQMPELCQLNCFVIPLFIDPAIFRDYGVERNIPVSVFGGQAYPDFYPWRAQTLREMQEIIPTLVFPHPGYSKDIVSPFQVRDEAYARLLSASRFSLSDTTRMDYVVRKHLEIPATGAILLAPDSEVLKPLGFVDMENCILGEGMDLFGKILRVAANPALEAQIRANGHNLIHSRYTRAHWTHMVDWFECRAACGPDEITQQTHRFGTFRNVPAAPGVSSIAQLHLEESPVAAVLRFAAQAIETGEGVTEAQAMLTDVHKWASHSSEPLFLLGVTAMLAGDLDTAQKLIGRRVTIKDGAVEGVIDPCELAYLMLIASLRQDDLTSAALLERATAIPHLSVRRALWLLSGSPHDVHFGDLGLMSALPGDTPSIHWIGQQDFPLWLRLTARLMAANGLDGAADYLQIIADAFTVDDANGDGPELQVA